MSSNDNQDHVQKDREGEKKDLTGESTGQNDESMDQNSSKPRSPPPQNDEAFTAKFDDDDPDNPYNWSPYRKAWITFQVGMMALSASMNSSIISPAQEVISREYHVRQETTILLTSLYVAGFAVGPCAWAPIAETYGRRWSLLPALTIMGVFTIGAAVSRNFQSIVITRFLAGVFGSAPVGNAGATLGDIYEPKARGVAITTYAVMTVGGPTLGPIVGSALTNTHGLGWRWTEYIAAIFIFLVVAVTFFGLPEVYGPLLLKRKAKQLRKNTGDGRYWHPQEQERMRPSNIVTKYFSRPLRMLFTEPMVTCISMYASFVYGLLYMTLEFFPIVFRDIRGFGPVVSTLPFLGLFIGILSAVGVNLLGGRHYGRALARNGGRAVPEARLPPMVVGGFSFTAGLFWFGWTASPNYHWAIPTVAAGFIGAGFNIIFQQAMNYLIDTYTIYAASAIAGNTFLRSVIACGLPLAARPMFESLGPGRACSVLGGLSCLALPVPFVFLRFGARLRARSKFTSGSKSPNKPR